MELNLDTQPSRRPRGGKPILRPVLTGLIVLAGVIIVGVLTLPVLLTAPPEEAPGYALPILGEVRADLSPGMDALLVSTDGLVVVYVPLGAYAGQGTLILQSRRPEHVPFQVEGDSERIRAVDLLVLGPNQEVLTSAAFTQPILLCYKLDDVLEAMRAADLDSVRLQRFDERAEVLRWVDLPTGPGWEPAQLCATLDHISLFALAVQHGPGLATQAVTPTPTSAVTPMEPGLYSPPTP